MEGVDVVVVGAGPVGLLTAIELKLAGVGVIVLERLASPSLILKAGGIGPLGTEALRRRGMAAALATAQAQAAVSLGLFSKHPPQADRQAQAPRYSGHFGGLTLIRADAQREPDRLGSLVDQQAIEAMLGDRVAELGIEIRRDCEVKGLEQAADGIEVAWAAPTDEGHIGCRYLVGCDGGRSTVRKLAGFAFPGWDPTLTMYQAVAETDHSELLQARGFQYLSGGMFMSFMGRLIMIDFSGPPADRQAPVTSEEFEAVLRRVTGADVRVTALEKASRWSDNSRLVETYRRGRVLLAGDAAHIHSPFGGQGLSLGLADAANLGWKLAAVVRGEKPESLLDTYTDERRPVAEAVLANTLAQVAIMRPDPQSAAMREIMARMLGCDDANRLIGGMMSGLAHRYDLGPGHEDVGRLIGDRPIGADRTLYALMQDGSGVLLDGSADGDASKLVAAIPRVRCVPVAAGASMLIRPDACVAWATEGDGTAGLEDALRRWF